MRVGERIYIACEVERGPDREGWLVANACTAGTDLKQLVRVHRDDAAIARHHDDIVASAAASGLRRANGEGPFFAVDGRVLAAVLDPPQESVGAGRGILFAARMAETVASHAANYGDGSNPVAAVHAYVLRNFAATLRAAVPPEWLPIATAPRDGTRIQVAALVREAAGPVWGQHVAHWDGRGWAVGGYFLMRVLWWKPLGPDPEPFVEPAAAAQDNAPPPSGDAA